MKKPAVYLFIAGMLTLGSCAENVQENVIIFFVDDLGWREIGCYGNDLNETPHVDGLAEDGVLFATAYATAPVCSPTRASILTGKYPARLQITDWIPGHQYGRGARPSEKFLVSDFRNELPLEEVTLAEVLKEHGYRTASIGKWHLGGEGFSPAEQGFDINIGGNHKGQPPSYYHPYERSLKDGSVLRIPYLDTLPEEPYLTDRLTSEAILFIKEAGDAPFFLYLPFFTVHTPIQGREDLVEYYRKKLEQREDSIQYNPEYAAMVHCMDENVGRVLDLLDSLDIRKNTLIIFASDNGGLVVRDEDFIMAAFNYPLREGKGYLYEGGLRVSTIISGPGITDPGRTSGEMMATIDIMPTILEYLGIEYSDPEIDGISLMPVLTAEGGLDRNTLYWHYPHYHRGMPGSVIRKDNLKLIERLEDGALELYDLEADPGETNNLYGFYPRDSMRAMRLLKELNEWKEQVDAYEPALNPHYDPSKSRQPGL
jgi:arylsulfatase A-like enzyme